MRNPLYPERPLAEFYLRNQALATAGGATQFFEHEGKLYSHIFDPRTGWPAGGVYTSTVIAPNAAEADALATAFYVMQLEEVEKYCQEHPEIGVLLVCPQTEGDDIELFSFGMEKDRWRHVGEKQKAT